MLFNISGLLKILLYKITGKKIIVINEASGLGDYLWVRNFFKIIKDSHEYQDYKIIFCVTRRWLDFTKEFDSKYVDVFVPFWNPYKPLINEIYILKIFKFDVFLNFRAKGELWRIITNSVKADIVYDNLNIISGVFPKIYDEQIFSQMLKLPDNFEHSIEYEPNIMTLKKLPNDPYCVLVPGEYTEGYLTVNQLVCIVEQIYNKYKIKILFVGLRKDNKIFNKVRSRLNHDLKTYFVNCCGKFKTKELPMVVDISQFVLTTNTGMWHIALMLNKKTICFSSEYESLYYKTELVKYITDKKHLSNIPNLKIIEAIKNW